MLDICPITMAMITSLVHSAIAEKIMYWCYCTQSICRVAGLGNASSTSIQYIIYYIAARQPHRWILQNSLQKVVAIFRSTALLLDWQAAIKTWLCTLRYILWRFQHLCLLRTWSIGNPTHETTGGTKAKNRGTIWRCPILVKQFRAKCSNWKFRYPASPHSCMSLLRAIIQLTDPPNDLHS